MPYYSPLSVNSHFTPPHLLNYPQNNEKIIYFLSQPRLLHPSNSQMVQKMLVFQQTMLHARGTVDMVNITRPAQTDAGHFSFKFGILQQIST